MGDSIVKTSFQIEKEAKDMAIYNEWKELMSQPDAMATAVHEYLMNKYHIYSKSTIWSTIKRVEKRLSRSMSNQENS